MCTTWIDVPYRWVSRCFVDHLVHGVEVGVTVQEVYRTVEDPQQWVEVVRDHHDGDAELLADPGQKTHDAPLVAHVERRQRLVEDEESRTADERFGDGDALPLPTGQLRQPASRELGRVDGGQDLVDAAALGCVGAAETPTVAGQSEHHGVACADRIACRGGVVLRHVADQPGRDTRRLAEHPDLTGGRGDRPEHRVQQRRLARAARSDDGDDAARTAPRRCPSDQISRPPRTTLTSSKDSAGAAGSAASSADDTERLG